MASVSASVKNGEIVTSASQESLSSARNTTSTGMDKDAFLQLLVAQMKYQDPMEPTSNTEYIAQYAQFSQVEALNNMSQNMELSRYSSFVGKEVVIASEGSDGKTSEVRGFVDYVTFEGGKAYFSIEGNLYAASDMVTAISNEYSNAEDIAKDFAKTLKDLPSVDSITIKDNGNTITNLLNAYDSLNSYQKGFLDDGDVESMNRYVEKLNELLIAAANEAARKAAAEAEGAEETEEAEETEDAAQAADVAADNAGSTAEEMAENAAAEGLVIPEDRE